MKRNSTIEIDGIRYLRLPVKTKILTPEDDILEIIDQYARELLEENDIISISESPLAITQGRAVPVKDIKIGWIARLLWRFVANVKYGVRRERADYPN